MKPKVPVRFSEKKKKTAVSANSDRILRFFPSFLFFDGTLEVTAVGIDNSLVDFR